MKSLKLVEHMLADASMRCDVGTIRDFKSLEKRFRYEGESFLTITLPSFDKAFLKCLEEKRVSRYDFQGFGYHKSLPRFLGGLMELVFDRRTGVLLEHPSVDAIFCIHAICNVFKKVKKSCSPERVQDAFTKFVQVENELSNLDLATHPSFHKFGIVADYLVSRVFKGVDTLILNHEHIGSHGPGTTAERILGNKKFDFKKWHSRVEPYFPSDRFAIVNWDHLDQLREIEFIDPGDEQPVRVIHVPKTLKSPRIIAVEPCAQQFLQQSLLQVLRPLIETHWLTSERVNFTTQKFNQSLALSSSFDGIYSTLDLSEASDRVSALLVYRLLHSCPILRSAVFSCRTTKADVPGHGVLTLSKFASAGSALCFEIESLVFYTILICSYIESKNSRFTDSNIKAAAREVYTYGDDLIVPKGVTSFAIDNLEALGLKVNKSKSFSKGNFRESCGVDAYSGTRVTPVYCGYDAPTSRKDTSSVLSWIALSNGLHAAGFWMSANYCVQTVENAIGTKIPLGTERTGGAYLSSFQEAREIGRIDKRTFSPQVKTLVVKPVKRRSRASWHGSLLKCLGRRGNVPFYDPKHLLYSGRPSRLDIVVRWVSQS